MVKKSDPFPPRVLIADDEADMRWLLSALVRKEGLEPIEASDGEAALKALREQAADAILLDVRMPGMDGLTFLNEVKKTNPLTPIIVVTGYGSVESAVDIMKRGAYDYLTKPFDAEQLRATLRAAVKSHRILRGRPDAPIRPAPQHFLHETMGMSEQIQRIISQVELIAPTDFTVLVVGETGTGKELVTRAIHRLSHRAGGPFVPVDCGSIPPTLIESELFGHEKGSFTDAIRAQPGKFEASSGGTLFLDEIGNLPLHVQPQMLRALQEKRICRVGSAKTIPVDIRVVAATNQDLAAMVQSKHFRRDLYYRLNEFSLVIPPLRERGEDIAFLANRFLEMTRSELKKNVDGFTEKALHLLIAHKWHGNVRELRNVIRRAVLLCDDSHIRPDHLSLLSAGEEPASVTTGSTEEMPAGAGLKEVVRRRICQVERDMIAKALKQAHGNKAEVARLLKVDYKTIHTKVKEYGLLAQKEADGVKSG